MRFEDRSVGSVGDLITALSEQSEPANPLWFRGQKCASWSLVPSLGRQSALLENELSIMKRFIQLAIPQMLEPLPSGHDEWYWVFLMQHHHVPTRLLDWSESPLAAVWFAISQESDEDSAIWCLDPLALNQQAKLRGRWQSELPAFGRDDILDNYLPDRQIDGAGQVPIAAIASRQFRRIAAQQGNFTISHAESDPVEQVGDSKHCWRLIIPVDAKPQMVAELATLRYTELQLFPDLDRAAKVAMGGFNA